jgi:hypothetical protein
MERMKNVEFLLIGCGNWTLRDKGRGYNPTDSSNGTQRVIGQKPPHAYREATKRMAKTSQPPALKEGTNGEEGLQRKGGVLPSSRS